MAKTNIGSNASFLSTGKHLSIIGNHCYAYSGTFTATSGFVEIINFQSPKGYIVSTISCNGLVNPADTGPGTNSIFKIELNSIIIAYIKVETSNESMPSVIDLDCLIPPLTEVKVSVISDQVTTAKLGTVTITGRMYD